MCRAEAAATRFRTAPDIRSERSEHRPAQTLFVAQTDKARNPLEREFAIFPGGRRRTPQDSPIASGPLATRYRVGSDLRQTGDDRGKTELESAVEIPADE